MDERPILVVEDDGAIRRLIVECLRGEGYRCVAVVDAESALEALERGTFAAALIDNHLPGMSGVELIQHLRLTRPTLPMLLVTGDVGVGDQVRGLDAGATDYITKPFEPEALLAHVRAHLRRQDAWAATLEEELHRRAAVVRALAGLEPSGGRESAARTVCDAVMATGDVEGVGILWFGADRDIEVLVAQGVLGGDGLVEHFRADDAGSLGARAASGAWLEPLGWGEELMACAPLMIGAKPGGLLVLVAHDGDGADLSVNQRTLAAAADFSGMASRLLQLAVTGGPPLPAETVTWHVDADEVSTVFQPVLDLQTNEVVGWEALTRFADQTPPEPRFAAATAAGRGAELELVAIRHALDDAPQLPPRTFVAVNVSARTIVERRSALESLVGSADRTVVLELTEHDPVGDYSELRDALTGLRPAQVAVDDAGAGFSSLRHVMLLAPDFVKLDRSWISGIEGDVARQALVAGIAHFARVTSATLVAEGIETEAERTCVAELGVELGQGFLLGRPDVAGSEQHAGVAAGRSPSRHR